MKALAVVFALVAVLLMAACSTSPVRQADALVVPQNRMFVTRAPAPGDGIVLVIRDSGFVGHGCGIDIAIDGTRIARMAAGEKVRFPAAAGRHLLTAEPSDRGLCNGGRGSQKRTLVFAADAGRTATFRVGIDSSGTPIFEQTSF